MSAYAWTLAWTEAAGVRTLAKSETGSTNADAKAQLATLGHRSLVLADHQTAGRGRGDHRWTDARGEALLSSWIFRTSQSPQPILSALIGLALFDAARAAWPNIDWALHAPNDLHVARGNGAPVKIAGLLIETISLGQNFHVVIGLGFNTAGAPRETNPFAATSLSDELKRADEVLNENDWRRFLEFWIDGLDSALALGSATELNRSSRAGLRAALIEHQDFQELNEVTPEGSLVFKDGRRISWSEL